MLDISPELSNVCVNVESLNFLQLYADTPHRYPDCRHHAVSASIFLMNGITKHRTFLDKDAKTYITETRNNFDQLVGSTCRLEFVAGLIDITNGIDAATYIDEEKLSDLFVKHPLLVPFCHTKFLSCLRAVGLYLTDGLERHFLEYGGTGKSKPVWDTFQFELAVEKMLYGRPLCHISRPYSINLGPGVEYLSRCLSDSNGFLSLEDSYSCCADEYSHPPLAIYSKSEVLKHQMEKTFGLFDVIHGSPLVLGRRLVCIMLRDLYGIGMIDSTFDEFLCSLKLDSNIELRQRVIGGTSIKTLTESITSAKKAKFPMVICIVLRILEKNGIDISDALKMGIKGLNLGYFPALRLYDNQRNEGLYWKLSFGMWMIVDVENAPDEAGALATFLTPAVVGKLESLKLCHSSTLKNRKLPWMKPCIEKLNDVKLSNEDLTTVLTFVTCIARLMVGDYVEFNSLGRLEENLPKPVSQRMLQTREIQSTLLMNHFNRFRLWRLHHSLPYKLHDHSLKSVSVLKEKKKVDPENGGVRMLEMEALDAPDHITEGALYSDEMPMKPGPAELRHLPANYKKMWTACEMALIAEVKDKDMDERSLYEEYQKACRAMGIPDRSFAAFRRKLTRMQKATE